jgi:hypothetical protein
MAPRWIFTDLSRLRVAVQMIDRESRPRLIRAPLQIKPPSHLCLVSPQLRPNLSATAAKRF